jgi:hypothetical protein
MRPTGNLMLLHRRRKFDRFDSSLFIEFRPFKEAASYFLGLTRDISCEGLSFTFQNFALEPGQRLQFKLKHHGSNSMISFLGDVIWQEQKGIKCSAGVKFCDDNKKHKKILLQIISDSCNVPELSLFQSRDIGKGLGKERISRRRNRYRSTYRWVYGAAVILAMTAAVLFMPAVIENLEDGPSKPATAFIQSKERNNADNMHTVSKSKDALIHNRDNPTVDSSAQVLSAEKSNVIKNLEENISSPVKEKEPDKKLPVHIKELTGENKYYIQVASFKDPDIAQRTLSALKQDYPAAYLFFLNDFYKLRIPDIKTSAQGHDLLKDIEKKFNIKPILVERVQ